MNQPTNQSQTAGIVLCGGRSRRMGRPKLTLPFGNELMLPRVVRILSVVVSPIVVVAAPEQDVPELPPDVMIARDEKEGRGPLAGLAVGLARLQSLAAAAYVSSCDVPLLKREFIQHMIARLGPHEIAIPHAVGFHQPLAAVYRVTLVPRVRELLAADRLSPVSLVESSDTLIVSEDELREIDPNLESLINTNSPEEYEAALRIAELKVDR